MAIPKVRTDLDILVVASKQHWEVLSRVVICCYGSLARRPRDWCESRNHK